MVTLYRNSNNWKLVQVLSESKFWPDMKYITPQEQSPREVYIGAEIMGADWAVRRPVKTIVHLTCTATPGR